MIKQQQPGFTLIELSVALVIISIVSLMLYQSFYQTQRTVKTVDALMDYTLQIPTVYNQLEKDISTVFVPEAFFKELQEKEQKKSTEIKQSEDKKEKKPFGTVFQAQEKEKQLTLLNFISTHSLSLYDTVVPYNVRVVYRLVSQEGGLYRLTRQETTKLDMSLKKIEKEAVRSYDLLANIKHFSARFFVPEKLELPKKDNQGEQKKEEPKEKKRVYKELSLWVQEEVQKETGYVVPAFIQLHGTVVDPVTKRERSFEWEFKIAAFDGIEERLKMIKQAETKVDKKDEKKEKQDQKPEQPKKSGTALTGRPRLPGFNAGGVHAKK